MSENYCYDGQLASIENQLSKLNEKVEKLVEILDPSNKCECCKKPFEKCLGRILHEMELHKQSIKYGIDPIIL